MIFSDQKFLQSHIPQNFLYCLDILEFQAQQGDFTSWSVGNQENCLSGFWADEHNIFEHNGQKMCEENLHPTFDLASLTKPLFLNLYLRVKLGENFLGKISEPFSSLLLNSELRDKEILNFFANKFWEKMNLNSLLSHTSGADSWFWMGQAFWKTGQLLTTPKNDFEHLKQKNPSFKKRFQENLTSIALKFLKENNFGKTNYSDINYYLLSRIVENIFLFKKSWTKSTQFLNKKLDTNFFHASVCPSKKISSLPFYPYILIKKENQKNLSSPHFGYNYDTNANILSSFGGKKNIVSGHSGLFGTLVDLSKSINILAKTQNFYLKKSLFSRTEKNRFVFGLDTPSWPNSVSGVSNLDKNKVFGHLGYTGTSFWFHKKSGQLKSNILLTNRTAKRTFQNHDAFQRIFIYTNFLNKKTIYFTIREKKILEIDQKEVKIIISNFNSNYKIIWDKKLIRNLPNINETRKKISQKIWES
jgi:hypothetical protein